MTAPTEAIAVVLIGFPDLEPATTTTGGGPMGEASICQVRPAYCTDEYSGSVHVEVCAYGSSVPHDGECLPGERMVKSFPHCLLQGQIVAIPEIGTALTVGTEEQRFVRPITDDLVAQCVAGCSTTSCQTECDTQASAINAHAFNLAVIGHVSANNVNFASYLCEQTTWGYSSMWNGPYTSNTIRGPNDGTARARNDVMCCR